ncbi:SusC/RagA family TonB-linked outer membrane protein [Maribellus sediminis]|uniref:SusC/RagA family TonB-linked outer membrane protein n=1 Tax=Maribellus sediminis TaxID=2696285 RepID=UPI00142F4B87|nr:SusC/RagA family TonB-linked outer membrane protein [Maribellus sediminis]
MKKTLVFALMLFSFFCLTVEGVMAQTKTITGVVRDPDGITLPGANVIQKGTTNGTITNVNGQFTLAVPNDAVIVFSFVGLETVELPVAGQTTIDIQLEASSQSIDEVVAIGYQTVHKKDLTASVTSIGAEDLENIPVTSVSSLLASQSTGVQNITLSGAPGARGAIMIRGNTSISGDLNANTAFSNPLYVVDGVQTSLEDLAGYNVSNLDFLASLNPADIESIDILKDASAAAIYGSRGANGVIIINTKKGKAMDKPEFTFTANYGFQPKPELVGMLVGAAERRAKMDMINTWWTPDYLQTGEVPIMLTDSLNPAFNNNIDYQGLFYQTGVQQQYSFSMRGGSEASNYRISFGYDDNKGVVKATGLDRYTFSANLNSKVGKLFRNQLTTRTVFTDQQTGQGNPYHDATSSNPALPVDPASLQSSLFFVEDSRLQGLQGELEEKMNTDQTIQTTLSNLAQLDVFKGLTLNSQLTFVYSSNKKNFYEPSITRQEGDGFASYALYTRRNLSSDTYLSYFKEFGDHEVTGILGQKVDYNRYEDMAMYAVGFGSDAIKVINDRYTKDEISGYTDIAENALLSYFARFSYKFKDRYIVGGNFSLDGSSRFGEDVRWAKFPSLSAAWVISDEPWFAGVKESFVDFAKVKFSWGINGKQFTENYLRYGKYNLGYGGSAYWTNQMNVSSYGGTTGVVPNYGAIGNDKLSWENSRQWNLGFELDMFKQRLSVTFDAYNKLTDKLFFDITFPAYSGYNSAKANVAGILNYGWESMVKWHVFPRNNKLRLELSSGLSRNQNFISKLPNGNKDYTGGDYGYVVGLPINLYKMFINDYIIDDLSQLPVNPYTGQPLTGKSAWAAIRPGFPIWKDLNGDYILNETHDLQLAREYSPIPDIMGSFNINLQYKGWYLRAYSQFSFGADIMNTVLNSYMDAYDRGGTGWAKNGLADLSHLSFWEKPGDGAAGVRFPAMYPAGSGLGAFYGFRGVQTMWLESGDYWKITNASIGYTFEKNSFISKLGLSRLRVYSSVLNPYQWQRSKTVVDASLVDAKGRVYGNGYPQASTISFGVDVRF